MKILAPYDSNAAPIVLILYYRTVPISDWLANNYLVHLNETMKYVESIGNTFTASISLPLSVVKNHISASGNQLTIERKVRHSVSRDEVRINENSVEGSWADSSFNCHEVDILEESPIRQ